MDKYIAEPITGGMSEVGLLKDNFVSIADGEKLLKRCEESRTKVVDLAKRLDADMKALNEAAEAEKAWAKFRWLKEAGAGTMKVEVVDVQVRAMAVTLGGTEVTAGLKGKTLELPLPIMLTAKVKDERRKFCLDKKAYARKSKTISVLPGPGGSDEDSLVYTSSTLGGKSSWLIKDESFDWQPSGNTSVEDDPKAVHPVYWKLQKSRVRWKLPAKAGEQVNVFVKGKIQWEFDQVLPTKKDRKQELNDGTATLVLKIN
jgi:CheY-like chemotaxis protein